MKLLNRIRLDFLVCLLSFIMLFVGNSSVSASPAGGFLKELLLKNKNAIGNSQQIIIVTAETAGTSEAEINAVEKINNEWRLTFKKIRGNIGKNGFAAPGGKREGDGKTPSGIYRLGLVFGCSASLETKMNYRQATENDFWVDDPDSPQYNTWVEGKPDAKSFEKMKRNDELYKLGVVVEYNMDPIVKGMGSAIFFHIWKRPGGSTAGCVALEEKALREIISWLDPLKSPIVIMASRATIMNLPQ